MTLCILHRARRSAWPAVRSRWLSSAARPAVRSRDDAGCDPLNNLPPHVAARVGSRLVHAPHHPLCLIKTVIEQHFVEDGPSLEGSPSFAFFDDLSPVVTAQQCFDDLLTPSDHISRSRNDTFYLDAEHVLRTHTSAHQCELIRAGHDAFLCTGDVYRKDTVDASHSPVFHQMEGVRLFDRSAVDRAVVEADLKQALEGMVRALFGELGESEVRWIDAYFPFTEPSFEMEIFYGGEWLEVLGCGVIEQAILDNCGKEDSVGWAFGLGLERLAMVRFGIPDIRLFWSTDPRFLTQFEIPAPAGEVIPAVTFAPFSKYPPCFKDVSFWVPASGFHENQVHEVVLSTAGELIEDVDLIDEFVNPKTGRRSCCFRLTYRSLERTLVNAEIDALQEQVRADLEQKLDVELR